MTLQQGKGDFETINKVQPPDRSQQIRAYTELVAREFLKLSRFNASVAAIATLKSVFQLFTSETLRNVSSGRQDIDWVKDTFAVVVKAIALLAAGHRPRQAFGVDVDGY